MYNHSAVSVGQILKIGWNTTMNLTDILTKYSTEFGQNITVFMFRHPEAQIMKTNFEKYFKNQHVKLDFFSSSHLIHYIRWFTDYTNASPIVGDCQFTSSGSKQIHKKIQPLIDDKIKCTKCTKVLTTMNFTRHSNGCNGIPTNTCRYCLHRFGTRQEHSTHKRICNVNPINR